MAKKLKIGDKVLAFFLGSPIDCEVIMIVEKDKYKLKSVGDGTIFPNAMWKTSCPKDKKGNITSPWYIHSKKK